MKNKGLLLIAGGIAIAAAIIAWLMFGGEAPKNPDEEPGKYRFQCGKRSSKKHYRQPRAGRQTSVGVFG